MRTYILKYKYDNLVHILLLALNLCYFRECLGNLSFNDESAGIEANPIFFSSIRSRGWGLYIIYLVFLNYIIAVHQTKLIQK